MTRLAEQLRNAIWGTLAAFVVAVAAWGMVLAAPSTVFDWILQPIAVILTAPFLLGITYIALLIGLARFTDQG